ncbi:hypothetical protein GCM10007377_02720 [Galliscardovia ingluviei]|uniref:Methylated-DNA-[protein]-cysteine S-methyltransferase DNA binding domain-containing protein n=1 Tax=Galliscardovia ingluviei TaxID=1769422 RepID=A0A8J3AF54_9BIFI|nr:MGMT family protein [Galliscardovia ingluviei]GGI12790.1 hypothetical protein GCM10007377_02720 [Galliscardovia ingluviei]
MVTTTQPDHNHDTDSFAQRVYRIVCQIPKGKVATYGQIAALLGAPRSARYVGFALHANPQPGVIPCHRVVFKNGACAPGFAFGGPDEQRKLLEEEGVTFIPAKSSTQRVRAKASSSQQGVSITEQSSEPIMVVDMQRHQWNA